MPLSGWMRKRTDAPGGPEHGLALVRAAARGDSLDQLSLAVRRDHLLSGLASPYCATWLAINPFEWTYPYLAYCLL